jgi:hypothetical protein
MEEVSRILLIITQFVYLIAGIPAIIIWWNGKGRKEETLIGVVCILFYILNAIDLFHMFII